MKKDLSFVEKYRFRTPMMADSPPGCFGGCFCFLHNGKMLNCIATDGKDPDLSKPEQVWEHVSCHCVDPVFKKEQTPTWEQMSYVASLFWEEDELLVQYRPAKKDYVNVHEHVLHWWKPVFLEIPTPPLICV